MIDDKLTQLWDPSTPTHTAFAPVTSQVEEPDKMNSQNSNASNSEQPISKNNSSRSAVSATAVCRLPHGKQSTKRTILLDASSSSTHQDVSNSNNSAAKKIKVTISHTTSANENLGFPSSELTRKEDIFHALRTSRKLVNLSDKELELLSVCVYLKDRGIPEQLLHNYCKDDSKEVQLAVNNLVTRGILTRQEGTGTLCIFNGMQKELRQLINNDSGINLIEEAILDKLLQVLIAESGTRKEGHFPYLGYIQDIVLHAIAVWELCFKYKRLIEKYFDNLETLAVASYEEMHSKGSCVLFLSKTIRQLSALYGHEDIKTLSAKLILSFISARSGKLNQALDELDGYVSVIESKISPDFISLLLNALEKRICILKNMKKYAQALITCNKLLDLDVDIYKISDNFTLQITHLKIKILNESGHVEEALELCEEISKKTSKSNLHDITYTQAKILHSRKKYTECLTLLDSVIATRTSKYSHENSSVLAARLQKSETLEDMSEYDLAIKELNSILTICEEKFGNFHMKTLNIKSLIARVLLNKGNKKESFTLLKEMLKIANDKFGEHSNEVKDITNFYNKLVKLANTQKINATGSEDNSDHENIVTGKKNNYSEYKKYYLDEYKLPLETSPEIIEKRAYEPIRKKNYIQAYSEASTIYVKIVEDFGDACPGLEQPLEIIVDANHKSKFDEEELKSLKQLYNLRLILYGEKRVTTFNTLRKIADLQNTLNLKAEALVSYETLYKYIMHLKGPDDVRTFNIIKKISLLQIENYQFDDAIKYYEILLQIIEEKNSDVDEGLDAWYNIAMCHLRCGRIEEAFQACSKLMSNYLVAYSGKNGPDIKKYQQLIAFIQNVYKTK